MGRLLCHVTLPQQQGNRSHCLDSQDVQHAIRVPHSMKFGSDRSVVKARRYRRGKISMHQAESPSSMLSFTN